MSFENIEKSTKEAESRQLEYDPNTRATFIRNTLNQIQEWMENDVTDDDIKSRIPEFIELYPELFKKIIQHQNLSPMYQMLSLLDTMGKGKLSQHQASIQIGQQLVDQFVKPQLNHSLTK